MCISIIALGIAAFLTSALAEAASTVIIKCVDYPAGSSASSGCHTVADNTNYSLQPIVNEGFKQFSISMSIVGVAILAVIELAFIRKTRMAGRTP